MIRWPMGAAVALALMACGPTAWGFGTIDGLGQGSEHRRITVWALNGAGLEPETLRQLAGRGGFSFGAVGAPDNPLRGLVDVKAAHCDGGDRFESPAYPQAGPAARTRLEDCRTWISDHMEQAVVEAGGLIKDDAPGPCRFGSRRPGPAKCRTLADLGLALHAAQDFYAHTNWVDHAAQGQPSVANPPGLGRTGAAPWLAQAARADFPQGLISGCYDGFPEIFHCGALTATPRVRHLRLEKDTGPIDPVAHRVGTGTTPRGRIDGNFERAVDAAVAETQARWSDFEARIATRYGPDQAPIILCRLKSDRPAACPH